MHSLKLSIISSALSAFSLLKAVRAHGFVSGIVIDGKYYQGYNPTVFPYQPNPPQVIGWTTDDKDTGFVLPSAYGSGDIICHRSATNGGLHATVAAGSTVELQWNQWPDGHHGPVLDYLAPCNGDCETVDKNSLEFFKIHEAGLISYDASPGKWASDNLLANNASWTVTIPSSIKPGNYVLRHEIIALHQSQDANGAQNYPQCINLEITGSGTVSPAGIPATKFYTPTDPGIFLSIYYPALTNYTIPGPPLFDGASASDNTPSKRPSPSAAQSSSEGKSVVPVPATSAPVSAKASSKALYSNATMTGTHGAGPAPSAPGSPDKQTTTSTTTIYSTTFVTVHLSISAPVFAEVSSVPKAAPAAPSPTTTPAPVIPAPSDIEALTSAIPTEILSSAAPKVTAIADDGTTTFTTDGLTVGQLLDILKKVLEALSRYFSSLHSKTRRHARDVVRL